MLTVEEDSDSSASVSTLLLLTALPAIVLTVMLLIALRHDTPGREHQLATAATTAVGVAPTSLHLPEDVNFTLYILSSHETANWLSRLVATGLLAGWYASVSTADEEAELMTAVELADWFRYADGLPGIRVVDLRN
jgi:hypothetical protein